MPADAALGRVGPWPERAAEQWRGPLLRLTAAWAGLLALFAPEWAEMAHNWWNAASYNHILLIPPILVWLVRLRAPQVARLTPQGWWPGLLVMAGALLAWLLGSLLEIKTGSQLGAVMVLQAAVLTLLGPRVTAGLLFPLAYMLFLVPFGDELVPTLQTVTAQLAVHLTHASGVPAVLEGVFIDTPVGLFIVAEACSGVKFLVAMVALGTLVAHLCFESAKGRALFMAAAIIVPILANGVRAWGTIYIAQSQGLEFAAGFDHIVYGWVFFAVVMGALLLGGWRFFDRDPEDPLIDPTAIESSPQLARLSRWQLDGTWSLGAIALLALSAVVWGPMVGGPALGAVLEAVGLPAAPMDRPLQVP